MTTTHLAHNQVQLALHQLRAGTGRPLLLLHGLGERAPTTPPDHVAGWPGPVHALDFTGHGDSTVPRCGGYTAELLMADVDIALAHLGEATILGRGLGGYIAILIAGARPELVRGVVVDDGPGLHGGPSGPTEAVVLMPDDTRGDGPPDPYAIVELATDTRTADYAVTFVRHAAERSGLDQPITVVARIRPDWLAGVVDHLGGKPTTVEDALARYAGG